MDRNLYISDGLSWCDGLIRSWCDGLIRSWCDGLIRSWYNLTSGGIIRKQLTRHVHFQAPSPTDRDTGVLLDGEQAKHGQCLHHSH